MNLFDFKQKANLVPVYERFKQDEYVKVKRAKHYDEKYKRVAKGYVVSDEGKNTVLISLDGKNYNVDRIDVEITQKPASSIFDFIKYLTVDKKPWEDLSDTDKKIFSPYMINQWFSMVPGLIHLVDGMQKYTVGILSNELVYKMYLSSLPNKKFFIKYIKSANEKICDKDLAIFLAQYFKESTKNIYDIFELLDQHDIEQILLEKGVQEEDRKKMLK